MENTLENKAKFFAMYWNQPVAIITKGSYTHPKGTIHLVDKNTISSVESEKFHKHRYSLELKPISSISDEDAEYCIGKTECSMRKNDPNSGDYGMSPSSIFVNSIIGDSSYHIGRREADYLRSKGYAIKWIDKTVKDQVSDGWVKLKGETNNEKANITKTP